MQAISLDMGEVTRVKRPSRNHLYNACSNTKFDLAWRIVLGSIVQCIVDATTLCTKQLLIVHGVHSGLAGLQ